jgi:methyl-accepting chemotaxis protein
MGWRRWYDNLGLFWKITLLCLAIALPFAGAAVWFIAGEVGRTVERNAGLRLQELAYNAADKLDRNLFERYGDVQAFAQSTAARGMNSKAVQNWMNTMTRTYAPIYRLMVVADRGGKIIAANSIGADGRAIPSSRVVGRDVSESLWFQRAAYGTLADGTSLVEDVHVDDLMESVYGRDGALAMSFTAPIKNDLGQIVGVWSNRFNWSVAETVLQEVRDRARATDFGNVEFIVTDKNGRAIYTPSTGSLLQASRSSAEVLKRAANPGDGGYVRGRSYNKDSNQPALEAFYRSSGYSSYSGVGWTVAASEHLSEIGREQRTILNLLYALAGLIILGVLLGIFWVSRQVALRAGHLARAAEGLARGEIEQKVASSARDEIGRLAGSFDEMMGYQRAMAGIANRISTGDLSAQLEPKGENDALGVAFQRMNQNLRTLIGEIQQGSSNLSSASSQILASATQQASGVTEQSAAIAQTTATVEEVKASADQAVDMAQTVNENAQAATRVAAAGVDAARAATDGMGDIRTRVSQMSQNILALSEQTQQIGEIITTVGDLADQSNLLALNAAIEAARAGEHGKGFAVVAQEIRLLAEQSKTATAQVRGILEEIQRATNTAVMTTEQGLKVADSGSASIERVVDTITELADVIQQSAYSAQLIGASVRQHSIGMEQIAAAMSNINTATMENLGSTRHTKTAAEELARLATRLRDLTAEYTA